MSDITLNYKQNLFLEKALAFPRKNIILTGAAGTGKTTTQTEFIRERIKTSFPLRFGERFTPHKYLKEGAPAIVICSFTRTAVEHIKSKMPFQELKDSCITIHKLLEFRPVDVLKWDEEKQEEYTVKIFEPFRNRLNPLPHLDLLVIEEAPMVSENLLALLEDALSNSPQIIFLGDLNQLPPPPMMGKPCVGKHLLSCQVEDSIVELDEVMRQALDSPILSFAHKVLGNDVPVIKAGEPLVMKNEETGSIVTIKAWKKSAHPISCISAYSKGMIKEIQEGTYDPEKDIVLIPDNKNFGCIEFNKAIGTFLARQRGFPTFEVISRYSKLYFAVGDRVLYKRQWGRITKIIKNRLYSSDVLYPSPESHTLDFWGNDPGKEKGDKLKDIDAFIQDPFEENGSGTNQASHVIFIKLDKEQEADDFFLGENEGGKEEVVSTTGDVSQILHAWAITIYKAQGQEWDKVFLAWHTCNGGRMSREAIYTAPTRAKQELHILCPPFGLKDACARQMIPGHTLEDKIEFFRTYYKLTSSPSSSLPNLLENEEDED